MDNKTFEKYLNALENTNMYNIDRENELIYHRVGNNIEVYDYNMIKLCNIDGTRDLESVKLIYKDQLKKNKENLAYITQDITILLDRISEICAEDDTNTLLHWYFETWQEFLDIDFEDLIWGFIDFKNELKEDLK
jgi:hypothetical protein